MKIQCSLLIALFFIFNGCSGINIQGVCRHNALYCASVAGEKYPIRIAVGKWDNINHVQAQALVNDGWKFLERQGDSVITINELENFQILGYMNIKKYFNTLSKNQVDKNIPSITLVLP